MRKAWKGYKYKLHKYFKSIGGQNDVLLAKRKRHPDFKDYQQEDWEMICDRWCSPKFQVSFLKINSYFIALSCYYIMILSYLCRKGHQRIS